MAAATDGADFEDALEVLDPSLQELASSTTLKWIFVGGKGGVGKTTTSCSLATELAARRTSVLLLSTDPAHNISDAFCQKFTNSPTKVNGFPNLFAMEIDASFQESYEFKLKQDDGFAKIMKELVSAFPGVDEAMGFAELMQSVQTMPYDVIVFDTAPTGHTLRLLGFPDLLEKGLGKFGAMQGQMGGIMQMVGSLGGQESSEEQMAEKMQGLQKNSSSVRQLFQDPTRCTFVCVCIPEFLSVYETERLIQELCKHGIDSSNIVVNQVLFPEDCGDDGDAEASEASSATDLAELASKLTALPLDDAQKAPLVELAAKASRRLASLEKGWDMCRKKRRMQQKYLQQINDLYKDDFHVVSMPMLGEEVRGLDRLRLFASLLLKGDRLLPVGPGA